MVGNFVTSHELFWYYIKVRGGNIAICIVEVEKENLEQGMYGMIQDMVGYDVVADFEGLIESCLRNRHNSYAVFNDLV